MAETWKIQDQSLLENWSQYEIEEYDSYNSDTNTNTHDQITSKPRLEWNEQEQILTVSYFSKYFKDKNCP